MTSVADADDSARVVTQVNADIRDATRNAWDYARDEERMRRMPR